MTDPLIRPEPIQYITAPNWILPSTNPGTPDTWRDRDRQPPPRRMPSSFAPGASDPADDDDDYELVPRGGDRIGLVRVRKQRR